MLIKKSSVNKHKIISNNNIRNIHRNDQQPPSPTTASDSAFSFLTPAAVATSHNAQQHHRHHHHRGFFKRVLMRHHDRLPPHLRRTCERWCSLWWCVSSVITILGVIMLPLPPQCEAVGYSYTRFRGPVSGPEHLIFHHDHGQYQREAGAGDGEDAVDINQAAHLDYVAKPDYEFAYGVEDAQAHILHNRNEMRDGDSVKGVYSVVDPDGTLRVVKYTADDVNGFQAEVIKDGISSIHGQLQPDTPTTISNYNNHPNNNNNNDPYGNQYPSDNNNNNYNHHYHPSYHYPTPVSHGGNPPTATNDYNNNNNNNNDYDDRPDINNGNNNNNNGGDYLPQYEVHEKLSHEDEADDAEDEEDQYNAKKNQGGRGGADSKKKDYDDGEEEEEDDVDEYDDSDELEDYDEAVKNHAASDESDEYY